MKKKILMVAGPNGAGKTTMTLDLIARSPTLYEFLNANEIAKGLAPKRPESMALTASKLMITRLKELIISGENFLFEYLPLSDTALIINNASENASQRLIANKVLNSKLEIVDSKIWKQLQEVANG